MALPALLSGLGRQLAVQGAKGAAKGTAKKMLGGKRQEKNSNAIVKQQEKDSVGYKKSSALVPAIKPIDFGASLSSPEVSSSTKGDDGSLLSIKEKVIKIENLLGEQYKNRKKQAEKQRKLSERAGRKEKEERLEETSEEKKNKGKFNIPIPGKGLFGNLMSRVFNFLFWVSIGKILPTILEFLPQIIEVTKIIGKVMDPIINVAGFLLDGFITFVDFGFKVYDKIIGFADNIGGDGLVKVIEDFSNVAEKVLNLLFILSMAQGVSGGMGGKGGKIGFDKTGRKVSKSAQQRYFKKFGRDKFIKRFGEENLKNIPKSMGRTATTKLARKAVISPIVKRIPIIGGLIDFALNYFVFKEPVGRAAFAAIGSTIFGALGATAGSIIPFAGNFVGAVLGGLAGDVAGKWLYDTFFDKKKLVEVADRDSSLDKAKGFDYPSTGTNKAPISSPSPTPLPSSLSTSDIDSSSNDRGEGSKLAGQLGKFLDSKGLGVWGSGVHQHPEHPPWPKESGHSPNSLHYESQGARAIDIGGWGPKMFKRKGESGTDDQTKIIAAINEFNKSKRVSPVEFLHEGNEPRGHSDHVHIAYEGGGLIRPKGSMSVPNSFASYNSPKSNTKVVMVPVPVPVSKPQMSPVLENSMGGFVEFGEVNSMSSRMNPIHQTSRS